MATTDVTIGQTLHRTMTDGDVLTVDSTKPNGYGFAAPGGADGLGPDGDKGDITVGGGGTTLTIDAQAVTYAKMQHVGAGDKVLGRVAAAGVVEEIPCTAAGRALIDDADAAAQRTTLGLGSAATQPSSAFDAAGDAAAAVAAHEAAADPHAGYQKESEKGAAGGYASLDGSTEVPAAQHKVMVGDSGAGGTKGAVPAPAAGDAAAGKFLKADGTWAAPAGGSGLTHPQVLARSLGA